MIRVFIVDQVNLVCEVIAATLEHEADMTVAGMASSAEEAMAALPQANCDLVLISTSLPSNEALALTSQIAESDLDAKILVVGLIDTEAVIMRFIEAGASGYVLKEEPVQELLRNIRAVCEKKALISPQMAAALMARIAELADQLSQIGVDPREYEQLTPREKEVLDLIGAGYSNQEIADELTIELGTVKNHVHNILDKLNVNSRRDAAIYLSLIDDGPDAEEPDEQVEKRENTGPQA